MRSIHFDIVDCYTDITVGQIGLVCTVMSCSTRKGRVVRREIIVGRVEKELEVRKDRVRSTSEKDQYGGEAGAWDVCCEFTSNFVIWSINTLMWWGF